MKINPYQPPQSLSHVKFARHYRVDNSRTTLQEFRCLVGRPVLATIVWFLLKVRFIHLNSTRQPGPQWFTETLCPLEELPEVVRQELLEVYRAALELGFHLPSYADVSLPDETMSIGALRMAHVSKPYLLNAISGTDGQKTDGFQSLISASVSPRTVFCTSNSRPTYNQGGNFQLTRAAAGNLPQLLSVHEQTLQGLTSPLAPLATFEDIAKLIDELTHDFYIDKIERGIFIPDDPSS